MKAIAWQVGTLTVEKCVNLVYVNGVLHDIFPINICPKNQVHIILGSHGPPAAEGHIADAPGGVYQWNHSLGAAF